MFDLIKTVHSFNNNNNNLLHLYSAFLGTQFKSNVFINQTTLVMLCVVLSSKIKKSDQLNSSTHYLDHIQLSRCMYVSMAENNQFMSHLFKTWGPFFIRRLLRNNRFQRYN